MHFRAKTRKNTVALSEAEKSVATKANKRRRNLWSRQVPSLNYLETMHNEELNMLELDIMYS